MKKTLLIAILALLSMYQAMAQEYEYVPFVREGVKWVYYYNNPFWEDVLDMPEDIQYYSFEFTSDVQIGDKNYKPIVLTHYLDENNTEVEEYTPAYLREENKVVYAIHPDGIQHPQCPVGFFGVMDGNTLLPITATAEEFILYNFNHPTALYDSIWGSQVLYQCTDTFSIGGHYSKCYYYNFADNDQYSHKIIEGIGYDGDAGMPLWYFTTPIAGMQVKYGLSHVIEDGKIIYTGQFYDPGTMVGIDEVVADKLRAHQVDDNYYNLMGQPMGTDIPTTPGIYIHHGKKIVVR